MVDTFVTHYFRHMNNLVKSILILFIPAWVNAQTTPLTLREALDAAQEQNRSIKLSQLDAEASRAKVRQTQAVFLPQINLSYTAMSTNNPLNAFGFKLQQQAITAADFNPDLLNDPSATQNFMTKAELLQPIFNMDMFYQREAAGNQAEAFQLKHARTKQYIAFEVEKSYAQLQLAHQAEAVMEEAVNTAKAVSAAAQNRFDQGYLQKSDVLQVTVFVANMESKFDEAKSNVKNASDYLSLLMGVQPGAVYLTDTLSQQLPLISNATLPENRADIAAMAAVVAAHNSVVKSSTMAYVPKLNAFGEYMFNDSDAFGFGSNAYMIGAQLSWKIFNGTATKNKIATARIERDKASQELYYQKEQAQLELDKTIRQERDALNLVNQQALTTAHAREAFRLMQNRDEQGLVTTTELLQAQTNVAQQKLGWAQAIFQLTVTRAYLNFLTATTNP